MTRTRLPDRTATRQPPRRSAPLQPVSLRQVTVQDPFWSPRIETNREVTLPHQRRMCRDRIDNFGLTWKPGEPDPPHEFWDSDVGKWIEAAAYSLTTHPDPVLEAQVNEAVRLIAAAQQPDGYLNTYFTLVKPGQRWTNLRDMHELYCAGHLMEGAVALAEATGERALLEVMCRYADHIGRTFGRGAGKRRGYCGHPEIELALIKLHRATGEPRYLRLARYFVDERGQRPHFFEQEGDRSGAPGYHGQAWGPGGYAYGQAHKPVREQEDAVGHAVRAVYLYSGMADVAAGTGDTELLAACRRLWDSLTLRKMYLTGGIGSRHQGEALGADYELPNETAYAETCAAIGLVFFAHRMLQIEPHRRYSDVMEQALYNGVLSGISLDGRKFFYVNPLESAGGHHRQEWFGCACCPPNVARLLASLGRYIYSRSAAALYVHLYIGGTVETEAGGAKVRLHQATEYPWRGTIGLTIELPDAPPGGPSFALMLRIPGWCRRYALRVNGKPVAAPLRSGYAALRRRWRHGDKVALTLDMPAEMVAAHPAVADDAGRVALRRGPLVYCLEQCDHAAPVRSLILAPKAKLTPRFEPGLLGGIVTLHGKALLPSSAPWKRHLYRPAGDSGNAKAVRIKAVPYAFWDNRAPGAMRVWLTRGPHAS